MSGGVDEGVILDLYKEDGTLKTHMTSDKAELCEATNDMVAIGNVVVVDSNRTLKTERLHYIAKTERIYSNVHVTVMYTDDGSLTPEAARKIRLYLASRWNLDAFGVIKQQLEQGDAFKPNMTQTLVEMFIAAERDELLAQYA